LPIVHLNGVVRLPVCGEDQNTLPLDGKKGHLSGTVGPEPAVLMVVQFDTVPIVASACRFR
jgi:hypothetical protein